MKVTTVVVASLILSGIVLCLWLYTHIATDYRLFIQEGDSMSPTVGSFGLGIYEEVHNPSEQLEPGMVVIFKTDNDNISHRYLYKEDGLYYFRGDNNQSFETIKDESKIKYIYRYNIVNLGGSPDKFKTQH